MAAIQHHLPAEIGLGRLHGFQRRDPVRQGGHPAWPQIPQLVEQEERVRAEGERVVTSAEAGAFPAGLPVGVVRYSANNVPEVLPYARLDRLEVVRLFDYGLNGVTSPEASVSRQPERRR